MELENIREELDRVSLIVSEWGNGLSISNIERDLVLGKLRRIYEKLMLLQTGDAEDRVSHEKDIKAEKQAEDKEVDGLEKEMPSLPSEERKEGVRSIDRRLILSLYEGEEVCVIAGESPKARSSHEQEDASKTGPREEGNGTEGHPGKFSPGSGVKSPASGIEAEPDTGIRGETVVASSSFGSEPVVSEPKEAVEEQTPFFDVSTDPVKGAGAEGTSLSGMMQGLEQAQEQEQQEQEQAPSDTAVLGEVLGTSGKTIGESLAADSSARTDLASRVAGGKTETLRRSIGLNDRFLLIRDLFGGDAEACDAALGTLDAMQDLDDAMIHIHDTYDWDPNSEGVKLLVELLARKLN